MPTVFEGHLNAEGIRTAIIVSRFNSLVTESLLAGAMDCLVRHGANANDQMIIKVPGGWEIGLAVKKLLESDHDFDAVIALGCVMQGSTSHNEHINNESAKSLSHLSLEYNIPISFGVLSPNTTEQALERAGMKMGNKGAECAAAAIEMVDLLRKI